MFFQGNTAERLGYHESTCKPIKNILSGLRQFLATESPIQMMKNAFYFALKVLFVLKIFQFLSWLFGHVE